MTTSNLPASILVVDDEEAIVELVGEYLRARGMNVQTASDGDQALAVLEAGGIDLVLTDLRLPVRGGMSLLEVVVERSEPVAAVVMTGYGTIETATQALKMGAADYLLKPVRLKDLHRALAEALAGRRRALAQQQAQDANALYERLLGLAGPVQADDLLARLARVATHEAGAAACRVEIREAGVWRAPDGAPDADGPPWLEVGPDTGPALRLWLIGGPAAPPAEVEDRLRRLAEHAVASLVAAGADDLPVIA